MNRADLPARICGRIRVDERGCWRWGGYVGKNGYARFSDALGHRVVYELLVGPIPPGLVIDHLCRVRDCLNPEHMEPVTNAENVMRGRGVGVVNAAKTHCPNGHPLSGPNVRINVNRGRPVRNCKACIRQHRHTAYMRRREQVA